jgi:hypothetical protein
LSLPTELIYTILAISIGDYLADMMLYPSKIMPWDAILTFLHVSRSFRGSTIKMLYHLWGETFIRQRTSVIGNYKPTYSIFRELSRQARSAPHTLTPQEGPPKLLSPRVVRHPISPLARIWSALIRNAAAANAVLQDAEKDWTLVDFEDVYGEKDMKIILDSYAEIPAGIRPLLQGRIIHWIMTQAAIWTKLKMLKGAVLSVLRLLLVVEPMGQIEICTGLPKITEDAVMQISRDKHENLADLYSLDVEDIPPVTWKHTTVVGMDMALPLLELNERKGSGNGDLCQMMRSHIASHLTDAERVQYLI